MYSLTYGSGKREGLLDDGGIHFYYLVPFCINTVSYTKNLIIKLSILRPFFAKRFLFVSLKRMVLYIYKLFNLHTSRLFAIKKN